MKNVNRRRDVFILFFSLFQKKGMKSIFDSHKNVTEKPNVHFS